MAEVRRDLTLINAVKLLQHRISSRRRPLESIDLGRCEENHYLRRISQRHLPLQRAASHEAPAKKRVVAYADIAIPVFRFERTPAQRKAGIRSESLRHIVCQRTLRWIEIPLPLRAAQALRTLKSKPPSRPDTICGIIRSVAPKSIVVVTQISHAARCQLTDVVRRNSQRRTRISLPRRHENNCSQHTHDRHRNHQLHQRKRSISISQSCTSRLRRGHGRPGRADTGCLCKVQPVFDRNANLTPSRSLR